MKYEYANPRLRPASKERYDDIIKLFNEHLDQQGMKFSFQAAQEWLEGIYNPNTYNVSFHALKSWLRAKYAKRSMADRLRLREFWESIHMKQPKKAVDKNGFLTPDKVFLLVENAPTRISCMILALFFSGSRISALLRTKLTDCTIDSKEGYVYINTIDKCDMAGTVSITLSLYNKIRETFRGQTYLFETFEGKKYSREYVSREIHDVANRCELHANCHILRHSKAMYLKAQGYTPDEIARALRHRNILTTLEYYFHNTLTAEQQLGKFKESGV